MRSRSPGIDLAASSQSSKPPLCLSSVVEAGDLLISRSNTRDRVGLPGIFNEARCDVLVAGHDDETAP